MSVSVAWQQHDAMLHHEHLRGRLTTRSGPGGSVAPILVGHGDCRDVSCSGRAEQIQLASQLLNERQ